MSDPFRACGKWTWQSSCHPASDTGLHNKAGSFECRDEEKNTNSLSGPLKISPAQTYLANPDGSPFFWLADTAWNGVLRAKDDDWQRYLLTHKKQDFTAIQFVSTQWRGGSKTLSAPVYLGKKDISVNTDYLQAMDQHIAKINLASSLNSD